MRVKCLAQEHNTMSPARARTRTTRSGEERLNPVVHAFQDAAIYNADSSALLLNWFDFLFMHFPDQIQTSLSILY